MKKQRQRRRSNKLTSKMLKRIVLEEKQRLAEERNPRRKRKTVSKLTPGKLRQIVLAEKRRIEEAKQKSLAGEPKEVDADDLAGTLEKDLDWMKSLKIKEGQLNKALVKIKEKRVNLRKRILKNL